MPHVLACPKPRCAEGNDQSVHAQFLALGLRTILVPRSSQQPERAWSEPGT